MNLEEYLKLDEKEKQRYDFSNDGANEEYNKLDSYEDAYAKFFVYMYKKALSIKNYEEGHAGVMEYGDKFREECKKKYGKINDPDSGSDLLQKIYKELWHDETSLKYCRTAQGDVQGETMNSVNTTLNELYKYKSNGETCIETFKQCEERGRNFIKPKRCKTQGVSIAYIISRYAEKKTEQEGEYDNIKGLKKFLSVYHTLGNFIPVPVGCNAPRGTGKLKDYWDLTLKVIHDYYYHPDIDDNIMDIVSGGRGPTKIDKAKLYNKYQKWLDSFKEGDSKEEAWKCFVEKNFLQDFVDCNTDGSYGMPKELWKGHFSSGEILPTEIEQIEQFFVNASCWITARSTRMLLKLRKILMDEKSN